MIPMAPHGEGLDLFTSTALWGGQALFAERTCAKGQTWEGRMRKKGSNIFPQESLSSLERHSRTGGSPNA